MPDMKAIGDQLAKDFGRGIADAATIYLPVVQRMTIKEMADWADLVVTQKRSGDAYKSLLAKMTPDELAADKESLAVVTNMMADARAEKVALGNALMNAVMTAVLKGVLAAASAAAFL